MLSILWTLANREEGYVFRFSTLFTAQNVRDLLSDPEGLAKRIDWCKRTGVTRVYVETFRSDYTAERETLERVKAAYLEAGLGRQRLCHHHQRGQAEHRMGTDRLLYRRPHPGSPAGDL